MPSNPLALPNHNTFCSMYVMTWTLVAASSVFSVPIMKLCNMLPLLLGRRSFLRGIEEQQKKKYFYNSIADKRNTMRSRGTRAYLNGPSRNSMNSKMIDRRPSNSTSGSSRASKFNAAPINRSDSLERTTKLYTRNVFFFFFL